MNGCEKFQELISCLIDGEITGAEKAALDAHLEGCPSCRAYFKLLSDISLPDAAEPPKSLLPDVMAAVKSAPRPKRSIIRFVVPAAAAAACLAIVIISVPTLVTGGAGKSSAPESAEAPMMYAVSDSGAPASLPSAGSMRGFAGSAAAPECAAAPMEAENDAFLSDGASNAVKAAETAEAVEAPAPEPEPEAAPEEADFAYASDEEATGGASAVYYISGALPEMLAGLPMTEADGAFRITVPEELAEELADSGYERLSGGAPDGPVIVIYTP